MFSTTFCIVKVMVFPVVAYGCKNWTIKKAECQRIACELWCWRRLLRVPWTARRSNQSILKGINPEYSLERLMLKLKLQYFGHLMQRATSLEKNHDSGKDQRWEEKGMAEDEMVGWHLWLNGHEFEQAPGEVKDREAWYAAVHGVANSHTWLSNWTITTTRALRQLNSTSSTLNLSKETNKKPNPHETLNSNFLLS